MNRIYKVVWSKAKNCYTVVSEIAKRHGKGNRARTCAAAFLAAFALTGVMGMSEAQAQDFTDVNTKVLNSQYNLSVGKMADNGTMPFFVNSNGAFYAASGKLVVDKDGNVTAGNVVLKNGVHIGNAALRDGELFVGDANGSYSQITPNSAKLGQVTIDEKGNVAGANSIQTNALNAKYNLSVGTANENGTVPFFVNSNGAFYAANGKLVVDKDGNVTAGNVVLKNGVHIGNSALRDGELFVGDASGNYSQITTKGAKLGKVTVAENGKISGVAAGAVTADSTDAVNGSQLHAVATEAGKHSKVVNGSNINVEEAEVNGQKIYKVGLMMMFSWGNSLATTSALAEPMAPLKRLVISRPRTALLQIRELSLLVSTSVVISFPMVRLESRCMAIPE